MAFKKIGELSLVYVAFLMVLCISSGSCFFDFLMPDHARRQVEYILRHYPDLAQEFQYNLLQRQQQQIQHQQLLQQQQLQQQQFSRSPYFNQAVNRDPLIKGQQSFSEFDNKFNGGFDQISSPSIDKNPDSKNDELVNNEAKPTSR